MKRILYITKHNPWGKGGGSTASRMYLEAFKQLFINDIIDLCIADSISPTIIPKDFKDSDHINLIRVPSRSKFSKLISPFTGITHRYQDTAIKLLHSNSYDFCIFDHSSIAGTLITETPNKVKTITIHHNYEPDYFRANTTNCIVRKILIKSVIKSEREAFKNSFINIFLTSEDLNQFNDIYGKTCANNIVTGLFETNPNQKLNPVPTLQLPYPTIVITGSLNNVQNTDAIRYFINNLYSLIPNDYKLIIAGQNPNKEIINLLKDKHNIELIPNPPKMDDIIHLGNIYISPAYTGGGIKVRITDGLRNGLPVIAHDVSARGYEKYIKKGYFKTFSNPAQFSEQLDLLYQEIKLGKFNSSEISSYYGTMSSLDEVLYKLKRILYRNS
ncbi:MAG: glycosyltransferase family 4 protein [Muribaculum sp.]|nr:glycosyltransferase family 4 protein [Muribaculum sp.]